VLAVNTGSVTRVTLTCIGSKHIPAPLHI